MTLARLLPALVVLALAVGGSTAGAQRLADLPRAISTRHVPALSDAAPRPMTSTRLPQRAESTQRATHVRRGALWGLALYTLFAAGYVARERATCRGPECFGEGMAWIGLAGGVPLAAGVGAGIGALWPAEASTSHRP